MRRIYRACFLFIAPGLSYSPGELRVDGDRIVGWGPAKRGPVPARAILPGLVNAHVHLQLTSLPRPRRQFLPWIGAVMRSRASSTDADHRRCAEVAVAGLLRDGVTSVGEIDSTGLSPAVLRRAEIGGVCYQELTGFDLGRPAAEALIDRRRISGSRQCRVGLSPHAPYSASAALFRAAVARRLPMAIHVAETAAEVEFLATGEGPFRDLLERLGKIPAGFRAPGLSPVRWLHRLGLLGPRTTLIHAQHMPIDDARLVARRDCPIVVCPGTIAYFRRRVPPVPAWLELGIPVALGTDSLASNDGMSIRAEMARARRCWPELSPSTVLAMATAHGHRALGRGARAGFRRGGPANFLTVPLVNGIERCLDEFTAARLAPSGIWLRGRRCS